MRIGLQTVWSAVFIDEVEEKAISGRDVTSFVGYLLCRFILEYSALMNVMTDTKTMYNPHPNFLYKGRQERL